MLVVGAFASVTYAQTSQQTAANIAAGATAITYPIAELGSCKDKQDCKKYCDQSVHMTECVAYAEKQGLLKGEDLRISKVVAEKVASGQTPGGCTDAKSCEAYCNGSVEHLNACLSFGEQLGVIPAADLADAKKIAKALAGGAALPGACKTKGECETYCAVGSHIDECLNFAEASGIIPAEELAQARKIAPFLKNGETPGKCTTKAQCEAYCADASHFDSCLGFAEKAGFVSKEDATLARKTGGSGPGKCTSKDQCETYCNEPAHATECLNFAKDKGLLSGEQQQQIDTGVDRMLSGLNQVPAEARAEVRACLEQAAGGKEALDRILAKQNTPTKAMGDKFPACFQNVAAIMQKVMTEKYKAGAVPSGIPSGVAPSEGGAPSPAEIQAKIDEMRGQAGAPSIPSGVPNIPSGATGGPVLAPGGAPLPAPGTSAPAPSTAGPSAGACASFASAPSCDYVPAGAARDMCVRCKGQ